MHYTQVASPNVTWEVAKKNDIGFDLVAFNNRFSITFDYFHEKRTGIFMHRRFLPDIIGLESNPWANVGAVRSKGFDGNFQYKRPSRKRKIGQLEETLLTIKNTIIRT